MKKLFITFLISLFIVPLVNAQTIDNQINKESHYEENYSIIMKADKIQKYLKNQYNVKDTFSNQYPEYFGGIYISEDGKDIVIQIVEEKIPSKTTKDYKFYNTIINFDEKVKVEYVKNSFNELNDINNSVSEYITSKKSHDIVVGCYIDVLNNKSIVEMTNTSEKNKEQFLKEMVNYKANINQDAIDYIQTEKAESYATTIKAGGQIYGRQVDSTHVAVCSMGFRTRYNNQNGYVTAGHCLVGATSVASGTVLYNRFQHNQYYDYGFVATNSSYTPSNALAYPSGNVKTLAVVNYCPTITVNMEVAKSGITTEYTDGKVKGLNQTVTYEDEDGNETVIKGLVKTNLESDNGDSGAPVFIPRTDAQGGSVPLGVLSGGSQGFLGIGRTMYFTDITNMQADMQTGRY